MQFGHDLPNRPDSYFRKQERQRPVRDAIEAAKFEHLRRRLYRRFFEPLVLTIEDEEDRALDEQAFWEATRPMAQILVGNRM